MPATAHTPERIEYGGPVDAAFDFEIAHVGGDKFASVWAGGDSESEAKRLVDSWNACLPISGDPERAIEAARKVLDAAANGPLPTDKTFVEYTVRLATQAREALRLLGVRGAVGR